MLTIYRKITLLALVLLLAFSGLVLGANDQEMPSTPQLKKGQLVRIGYLEGGPFMNYPPNLIAFVKGLADQGWLANPNFPEFDDPADAKAVWAWLAKNANSSHLVFVKDGFYSNDWDKELRAQTKEKLLKRLAEKKDLDFMIAMGTWAGLDLANDRHNVATMVFSSSDPIGSKIIPSADDTGYPHLHARIDPTRYERQVRLFHDIIGFEKLGIAYEDTPEFRTSAAIEDVEKVAKERGFEVVECYTLNGTPDVNKANKSVNECHETLAKKVDALYITNQTGVNVKNMPALMAPLLANKIPTFSQPGSNLVRLGALMSIAQAGFKYVGDFHARIAGQIFNGASPGALPLIFEDPPKISLNLETAGKVGYKPSVDIIMAADDVFKKIESPE